MNWKRGLLRAWLLMTGLWLALNVVFHRPDVEVQAYWELREVGGEQPPAPAAENSWENAPIVGTTRTPRPQRPTSPGDVVDELLSGAPPPVSPIRARNPDTGQVVEWDGTNWVPVDRDLRERIQSLRRSLLEPPAAHLGEKQRLARAKGNLQIFALTAFLPPAILFVIGAGGLWVFSGFRRGDT